MKAKLAISGLFLAIAGLAGVAQASVPTDRFCLFERLDNTDYCHLKFPLITESTLFTSHPQLGACTDGQVDYYGSCDHDPLGAEEVKRQRADHNRGGGD